MIEKFVSQKNKYLFYAFLESISACLYKITLVFSSFWVGRLGVIDSSSFRSVLKNKSTLAMRNGSNLLFGILSFGYFIGLLRALFAYFLFLVAYLHALLVYLLLLENWFFYCWDQNVSLMVFFDFAPLLNWWL